MEKATRAVHKRRMAVTKDSVTNYNRSIDKNFWNRAPSLPPLRLTAPLCLYLGFALMGTLYPFELDPGPLVPRLPEFFQRLQHGPSLVFTEDFLSNILLFVPFGIIVSLHFPARLRNKIWPALATVLLACLLSSLIELAQLFVRNRHSSLSDILSNTAGGLAGALIVRLWPNSYSQHLESLISWKTAWQAVVALSLFLAWVPATLPILIPDWHLPGVWATDVTFNAGNDSRLTHPWYGRLHRVAIYARALDPARARECFLSMKEGRPAARQTDDHLLALYEFDESLSAALVDRTGGGADLYLKGRGRLRWRPKHGGLQLRHPARLSTSRAAGRRIATALLNSREFSLEVWITPGNLIQRGPALILSVAGLADNSNLLLGQSTRDLVFWVRTPASGRNLTALSVTTTNQPLTRHKAHVMAVFRDGHLELFVNGLRSGSLDLRRDAMVGLPVKRTHGARVAYAFLYFFPFTLFWSALARKKLPQRGPGSLFSVLGTWTVWLAALIFLLAGEILQSRGAQRPFDLPFLALGVAVISLAACLARYSSSVAR